VPGEDAGAHERMPSSATDDERMRTTRQEASMAFRNLAGRIARPKANILAEQGAQDFLAASGISHWRPAGDRRRQILRGYVCNTARCPRAVRHRWPMVLLGSSRNVRKHVSPPHPYRSDEPTTGMRMQRSKPDSTDRSVTSTPPRHEPGRCLGNDLRTPQGDGLATDVNRCAVVKASSGLVVPGVLLPLGTIRRISFIRRIRIPFCSLVPLGWPDSGRVLAEQPNCRDRTPTAVTNKPRECGCSGANPIQRIVP
jgi:hypothetical protein